MEKKETEVPASNSVTEPIQNEKKNKDKNNQQVSGNCKLVSFK